MTCNIDKSLVKGRRKRHRERERERERERKKIIYTTARVRKYNRKITDEENKKKKMMMKKENKEDKKEKKMNTDNNLTINSYKHLLNTHQFIYLSTLIPSLQTC